MADSETSSTNGPPEHPATQRQKIVLGVFLVLLLGLLAWAWACTASTVDGFFHRQNRAAWDPGSKIALKPGPPNFKFEDEKKQLVYVGAMDQKAKLQLVELFPSSLREKHPELEGSYWSALDKLAFSSNEGTAGLMLSLLLLGGLSGAIGVQLRSLVNYVGHACVTRNLDVVVWWPYYAWRPFTGFVLGAVIIAVIQAGHVAITGGSPTGTLGWASISFLAGFGEDELTQRLRLVTKTLFGMSSK